MIFNSDKGNPPLEKRWRLVHLPIVLSARKPSQTSKNVQKRFKIFKPMLLNILSTGKIAEIKLAFFDW